MAGSQRSLIHLKLKARAAKWDEKEKIDVLKMDNNKNLLKEIRSSLKFQSSFTLNEVFASRNVKKGWKWEGINKDNQIVKGLYVEF